MKPAFLKYLVSPQNGGPLALVDAVRQDGEILEGVLVCETTGRRFPIIGGVPFFAPELITADATARRFGAQWDLYVGGAFEQTTLYGEREDDEVANFLRASGIAREALPGLRIADVGCGSGRLSRNLAALGAEVIATDASRSVRAVGSGDRLHVVQADLFHLPFPDGAFDVVYADGVLHHTPNPRAAFSALARKVARGGCLAIYVYPRVMSVYRRVRWATPGTPRWPVGLLRGYCAAMAGLIYLVRILARRPQPYRWVKFQLFDTLACPYLWLQSPEEVAAWFTEQGLTVVTFMEPALTVRGVRPLPAEHAA
jgi:SAM-dependent methyltransferase